VEQLKLLMKELDMKTNLSIEPHFEPDILGSGFGYNTSEQLPTASVGDFNICEEDETETSSLPSEALEMNTNEVSGFFASKTFNNNHMIGGHKRRRKVKFSEVSVQDDEFSESELLSMCPPVRSRNESSSTRIFVEPEDSILNDGSDVGSEMLEGVGHKMSEVWEDIRGEKIEVITVRDDVVDDGFGVEEDLVETLNVNRDENATDPFCDIEIDGFDEENVRQSDRIFCKICDQAFVTDHDFKAHLASTHYRSRLFEEFEKFGNVCPICNLKSSDTPANMGHIGGNHEKVYDYYEDDKFSHRGDVNSNWDRLHSKKIGSVELIERNHSTSTRTPPLRGILKLTNNGNKGESPKSILRTPRPKSPVPQHSILKLPKISPKISPKKHQKVILRSKQTMGEGRVHQEDGRSKRVLLSEKDDDGDMMIDV